MRSRWPIKAVYEQSSIESGLVLSIRCEILLFLNPAHPDMALDMDWALHNMPSTSASSSSSGQAIARNDKLLPSTGTHRFGDLIDLFASQRQSVNPNLRSSSWSSSSNSARNPQCFARKNAFTTRFPSSLVSQCMVRDHTVSSRS